MRNILVIGAAGQIGTDLILALRERFGVERVIASDIRPSSNEEVMQGPFEEVDALNPEQLLTIVRKYDIGEIYLLAAVLSASAEHNPMSSWKLNMGCLFNVLELAREKYINKIFWPSSIAVFGPTTPKDDTPQQTIIEPDSVYGISKLAGERWCEYYYNNYDVDVRSIRYPGLISYRAEPGGGTTDYAVNVFHDAIKNGHYECFLADDTTLPMMYMPDAIEATIKLMEVPAENVRTRSSYNIAGVSFSPEQLFQEIRKHLPQLSITYQPDNRQKIAESWPRSINDSEAKKDWGWESKFDLSDLVEDMLKQVSSPIQDK